MKQKWILILCVLFPFTISIGSAQQNPQYTQYMFNGLAINPAVAGNDNKPSLTVLNRNQWITVAGAPVTQTLSAHTLLGSSRVGAGLLIVNDKIGVHKNQHLEGSLSYRIKVAPQTFLSMGMQGGVSIRQSNYSRVASTTGVDPLARDVSYTSLTMGAGFFLKSPQLEIGISAPEILPEKLTISNTASITWQTAQYFLYSKYHINLGNNLALEPSLLIKYFDGLPLSYDVNISLVIKKVLSTGLSYRNKESIGFLIKAKLTRQLQFGYVYDFPIGEQAKGGNGSHEVMIHYLFIQSGNKAVAPR